MTAADFDIRDRLGRADGSVAMSGVQALLRVTADQHRADGASGVSTAGLIAGYQGSPLAGVADVYESNREILEHEHIQLIGGVNEELAATMVWGSQLAHLQADCRYDGVFGLWYGKGPGIDRSLDALRHANMSGVDPLGGALVAVGDDPACKSSTIPSASEGVLADLGMPTLYPSSVQDVLDLGRWGYELSRFCGLWVGFKIHTEVADQYATVEVDPGRLPELRRPDLNGWTPNQGETLVIPRSLDLEAETFGPRLEAARRFVEANELDRTYGSTTARLGILAAGKSHADVRSALTELGIGSEEAIEAAEIRIHRPAMIWPLEPNSLRSFADGLEEILVVEEKRPFLETQVRDLLFDVSDRPRVTGRSDPGGRELLPLGGALSAEQVVPALVARIEATIPRLPIAKPRARIELIDSSVASLPSRSPYFCSGCPHNRSTLVPEGSVAGGGIGCHTMSSWMDRDNEGLTQMGGEGAQWAGMSPFVGAPHRFQNVGDGTFFHSGSMALRQAVASGTNVTYKILYNGTVAMTGGQDPAGAMEVPELTHLLAAEGVVNTVVVTDEPDKYTETFAANSRVDHRDNYDAVQRELREVRGVTAVIYDQRCAAELRRDRKRGVIETPTKRIFINEAVCDGCGDCGQKSNCMSVHPVETPFGRKTRIHQESCNYDYSCVEGNCPAFIEVEVDPDHEMDAPEPASQHDDELPEPLGPEEAAVLIVGIGGTGVVTVSQVLSTAALLDGKQALSLDQTGLAQKGGRVISNLKITSTAADVAPKIGEGEADAMLLFDVVGATEDDVLMRAKPGLTRAIVSTSRLPTGTMVRELGHDFPGLDEFRAPIDSVTDTAESLWIDSERVARRVFGFQPAANLVVAGIAYQRGMLPVSGAAIRSAIAQNGVAVEMNLEAFELGRRIGADPSLVDRLLDDESQGPGPVAPSLDEDASELLGGLDTPNELREILEWRIPELIAYDSAAYAADYVGVLEACRSREVELEVGSLVSETVARQLFKLMSYKDEYEVARLHLRPDLGPEIRSIFGPNATFSYLLDPPSLKRLHRKRKVSVPERAGRAMFSALVRSRRARGRAWDPFGRSAERRIERELIVEYRDLVDDMLGRLTPANVDQVALVLNLVDQVKGFDEVKLANVARYRAELSSALAALD